MHAATGTVTASAIPSGKRTARHELVLLPAAMLDVNRPYSTTLTNRTLHSNIPGTVPASAIPSRKRTARNELVLLTAAMLEATNPQLTAMQPNIRGPPR